MRISPLYVCRHSSQTPGYPYKWELKPSQSVMWASGIVQMSIERGSLRLTCGWGVAQGTLTRALLCAAILSQWRCQQASQTGLSWWTAVLSRSSVTVTQQAG